MTAAFFRLAQAKGEVCSVACTAEGHILMGQRRDNQRFTLPGGHKHESESIHDGAKRELKEEAGIDSSAGTFRHLGSDHVTTHSGKRMTIHSFHLELPTKASVSASVSSDPDQEVYGWNWEPYHQGLSRRIVEGLHSPKNSTLRRMGLLVY